MVKMSYYTTPQQLAAAKKRRAEIATQIRRRKSKSSIVSGLVDAGMDPLKAKKLVEDVLREMYEKTEGERTNWGALGVAVPAGFLASAIGGAIWGAMILLLGLEAEYMTLVVGLLTGLAVVFFSGQRGLPYQIVSALLSLVGMAIGHYVSFYVLVKAAVNEVYNPVVADQVRYLNLDFMRFFMDSLPGILDRYDVVWLGLGMVIGFLIPLKRRWRPIQE
jgi:MFS family permease